MEVNARDINVDPNNGERSVLGMPSSSMQKELQQLTWGLQTIEQEAERYRKRINWLSEKVEADKVRILQAVADGERVWVFTKPSDIDTEEALSPAEKTIAKHLLEERRQRCLDPDKHYVYIVWTNAAEAALQLLQSADRTGPSVKETEVSYSGGYESRH